MAEQQKMKLTSRQTFDILYPYARTRVLDQVKAVSFIVLYLIIFQTMVLGLAINQALTIALGLGVVIFGLAFFMEGLFLGLMPLGEQCGVKLPQKLKLPLILVFAFILGVLATFAEPAIGVLQQAGSSVKAWNAPLLFLLLNKYSFHLKMAVGVGVGIAVLFGMLRFVYHWSLKAFIYLIVPVLLGLSLWAFFEPNLRYLTGVAWDCGGITTGPVTVPLVLALGIGVSRILAAGGSGVSGGFGVVTLASAFPILTVMLLGVFLIPGLPKPTTDTDFFSAKNRSSVEKLYKSADHMKGYALLNASPQACLAAFDGDGIAQTAFVAAAAADKAKRTEAFGSDEVFFRWLAAAAPPELRNAAIAAAPGLRAQLDEFLANPADRVDPVKTFWPSFKAALLAILLLSAFLLVVFLLVLRERLPRTDEVILGILFAVVGMTLFNIGIELGLGQLGKQTGAKLPTSFKAIELRDQARIIRGFDESQIQKAARLDGGAAEFFFVKTKDGVESLPFERKNYDARQKQYKYIPFRGPLFGKENGFIGILVVLLFGFLLGYGATLAEPALNALGATVEELSVGTFKKSFLIQAVAIGVGIGIAWGVAKIVWDWPLIWMLIPPYALCIALTVFSTEDFVNIGWDSAGVTTGPITVPLVLAMGLGLSSQLGVVEGFGVLALASVWPILSVLVVGLFVTMKRKAVLRDSGRDAG